MKKEISKYSGITGYELSKMLQKKKYTKEEAERLIFECESRKKPSDFRAKHSMEVGRFMEEKAREKGWDEMKCHEMYLLGYLHDLGYEYVTHKEDHAHIGGLILKESGYKYWQEIYHHGHADEIDFSDESLLLNDADMTVDAYGRRVGYDERLNDIGTRYGKDSEQYYESKRVVKVLKKRLG